MAEVGRDFWKKLGSDIARGKTPSGAKKPQKVVAEAPEDDENTPDAAGGEGGESRARPSRRRSKAEPVAAAEGGGEGEEQPKKKKKKKKKTRLEGEGDVVEEQGAEVVPPTFDAQVGPSFINRSLAYHQDASSPGLRPYSLGAGPAVVASLDLVPARPVHRRVRQEPRRRRPHRAGVPGSRPACPSGEKFGTSIHEFSGGIRYRMPFGAGQLLLRLGDGRRARVHVQEHRPRGNRSNLDIPDTIYRFLRPASGSTSSCRRSSRLALSAGYRYIFNGGGQFKDVFFPHLDRRGRRRPGLRRLPHHADASRARLVGDLRRYFSSMNCWRPSTARSSTSATEQPPAAVTSRPAAPSTSTSAPPRSLAVTMGGTAVATAEEEEPPPPPKRKRKSRARTSSRPWVTRSAARGRRRSSRPPARDPPRGHGRVLRVRRAARRPCPARPAGDRGRATPAGAWCWRRRTRCGRSGCAARCRWRARCRLAPDAIVVPPRHDAYADASARVFEILESVTPLVRAAVARRGVPGRDRVADAVRRARGDRRGAARAHRRRGRPARVGRHRGGQAGREDRVRHGQAERPARGAARRRRGVPGAPARLAPVGRGTEERARASRRWASRPSATSPRHDPDGAGAQLGPSGRELWEQANAIDPRPVIPDREAKSIGAEDTFDEDLTGVAALSPRVHAQALRVARRLRARGPARADGAAEAEARATSRW